MLTLYGYEMYLTPEAEAVAKDLQSLGAQFTSGYRDISHQASAMADNILLKRDWIGKTYRYGQKLQELVNCHPEWLSKEDLSQGLYGYLVTAPLSETNKISHHLSRPCPCFDIRPMLGKESYQGDVIKARISRWLGEGVVTQVLWREGGLDRWHVEVGTLYDNKKRQEV